MIALRHSDVDELNHRARIKMAAAGRLTGPTIVTAGGIELQTGDRIVCLRNDGRLGATNGTRATITRADPSQRTVEATDDHGRRRQLSPDYLDAGHVTHGYAITGHKAQGLTCDHTYTLGTETLYREWGYVAMSRGRLTNQLYHGPAGDHDDGLHHHVHLDDNEVASLTSRLGRSRAETPLADQTDTLGADIQRLEAFLTRPDVQRQRDLTELRDELTDLPNSRQIETADNELRRLRAELGTPPSDPHARTTWRATARALERHRLRWNITDPDQPFSTEIASPTQSDEQRRLRQRLDETRQQLDPHVRRHRRRGLSR